MPPQFSPLRTWLPPTGCIQIPFQLRHISRCLLPPFLALPSPPAFSLEQFVSISLSLPLISGRSPFVPLQEDSLCLAVQAQSIPLLCLRLFWSISLLDPYARLPSARCQVSEKPIGCHAELCRRIWFTYVLNWSSQLNLLIALSY